MKCSLVRVCFLTQVSDVIMVNITGARLAAALLVISVTVLIVVKLNTPVLNFYSVPQVLGGSVQKMSGPVNWTPLTMDSPNLPADIGKGPLSFVREKGHVIGLVNLDLDKLTTEELLMTIHSHTDNTDILCQRKFRMGNIGDGGWEICDDPDVRPRDPCIIYSFGINNDFSFDDDAAKMYGCHVYAFDPSMTNMQEEVNRSSNVHFYRLGLDGQTHVNDKKWAMYTFQDVRKKLGHQSHVIDVVKMDIETSEWSAVPQMAESGALDNVRQFLIEFHVDGQDSGYLLPRLTAIQSLERTGLNKFYVHKNPGCKVSVNGFPLIRTTCYELHYLKRKPSSTVK